MHAILLIGAMLALGAPDVETTPDAKTQLYVKTVPPGAAVVVDGKTLGKSDGLFDLAAGTHKLNLKLDGFVAEARVIEIRQGEITRVEVRLKRLSDAETVLSHVADSSDEMRSFADSGFAVAFRRPEDAKSIAAVKLFAARYGTPEPPEENFHIYLLDEKRKVLEQIAVPYSRIERGPLRWYTLEFPAIEVPEKFYVALWFDAESTKGVYLGMDRDIRQSHSFIGLPDKGFHKVNESYDWMIRAVVTSENGKKPTYPKVTTYEEETTAAESSEMRTWSDSTGAFSIEAQLVGVKEGKVILKKANGKTVAIPLDRLSKEDRDFVASQSEEKETATKSGKPEARELSHDNGKMSSKSSIAGGGHAVKFKVDGDSFYVTSVSLHGSRYGEARPPKENFKVWICDAQFKPIATFSFPYSSYARGEPAWKSFRIRATRVPREFIVCFGFNPHQTKGVYASYDGQASEDSMTGVPGSGPPRPFTKGNWMIRCKVENRP
jgi:hypothetical protein